jgi:hypothetical protein
VLELAMAAFDSAERPPVRFQQSHEVANLQSTILLWLEFWQTKYLSPLILPAVSVHWKRNTSVAYVI